MSAEPTELRVDVAEPGGWARRITVTVPAERVERQRRAVAKGWAERVRLPGFRKGRVPDHVLEKQYGPAIRQETVERIVNEAYREALEQSGLRPISQAEIDELSYEPGQDLTFQAAFEIQPEIVLERVSGFKVKREVEPVTDEHVQGVLGRLREEHAVWTPVEEGHPAQGDLVRVEITPLGAEGEEAGEPEPRSYDFRLGEGRALEAVEDAIRTLGPGETREFTVTLPADGDDRPEREQRLRIELQEVKRAEPPELDDEFARGLGDFEDLESLRARIRADLEEESRRESERRLRRDLLDRVIEANPFDVPDAMVDEYLERMLPAGDDADAARIAEFRTQARPAAEQALKRLLVIDRLARRRGLRATSEDVDARVEELAERHGRPAGEVWAELQKSGRLEALEEEITERKVLAFLKAESGIE